MVTDKIVEQALKQARRTIVLSSWTIVLGVVFTIQFTYFPNTFRGNDYVSMVDTTATDPGLMTMDLDPTEIENGIHMPTGLIVDDGVDIVIRTCGACHSLDLVTQNKADKKGWKDIIVWMQETQGLWDLGPTEDIILTYLSKNYAPEDTGRRKNLENIVWYKL